MDSLLKAENGQFNYLDFGPFSKKGVWEKASVSTFCDFLRRLNVNHPPLRLPSPSNFRPPKAISQEKKEKEKKAIWTSGPHSTFPEKWILRSPMEKVREVEASEEGNKRLFRKCGGSAFDSSFRVKSSEIISKPPLPPQKHFCKPEIKWPLLSPKIAA